MTTNQMTNSHILFNHFDYYEPATLAEAVALLAQHAGRARILAGGTDLLVQMKVEKLSPPVVISINAIPGLDRIAVTEDALQIGSRASIMAVDRHPLVRGYFGALAEACANFSSTQVQTMGTVGGNLGNASPAADSAPALIAFGAEVVLAGPDGERRLPLEQFFVAPGKTAAAPGELITALRVPRPRPGTGSAFNKIARVANDIAKANCAVVLVAEGDRVVDCRLAFGSVAPRPIRTPQAEALLIGQVWSDELVERVAAHAAAEIMPIDDVRSTAWYRREAVKVMVSDGLRWAWQRAACCDDTDLPRWAPAWQPEAAAAENGHVPTREPLAASERRLVDLKINGHMHRVWVAPNDLLLNVLRNDLELTGTKYGCGIGECSACTVLMDGHPVLSCLVLAVAAAGHDIVTVEGLAQPDGTLDPVQDAFIDYAAYQCGYCTPGMLMTAKSLLNETPQPTEDDVRHYLRGNMCRCTGYAAIVRAVLAAADQQQAVES